MKKEDVPQEFGLTAGCQEVNYAVDDDGRYSLEQSSGWEAKTIALQQAWDAIADQLRLILDEIVAGKRSPLAYYMVKNQMDSTLLAQYSGVSRWRVKRHLKPSIFNKLTADNLAPYAELFGVNADQLRVVPKHPELMLDETIPNRDK